MTTPNINLYIVLFYLGTQTLCGRNEPPKHDTNLTFYVPGLKPRPNDLQMTSNSIFSIPNDLQTQTLCGRIEPLKHDVNLTFYVPGLNPKPNDLEMA